MSARAAEEMHEQVHALLDLVRPVAQADQRRREAFELVKGILAQAMPESHCFLMGSFPLRTYLPDSDIDLAVLVADSQGAHLDMHTTLRKILDALYCAAMQPEPHEASQTLRNISFVNANTPVVRCTVGNIDLDLTVNQLGSLGAITFLEEADRFIGKQHLFKRSLLLVKLWLSTEAVTYAGRALLGAKNGMFSSYAVSVMVLYLFNAKADDNLNHPFEVLKAFLETFSRFPWESCVLTLQGAVPIQIGKTVAKPADMPPSVDNRFRHLLEQFHALQHDPLEGGDSVRPSGKRFKLRVCNIQDPLNADNNLTVTITKATLSVIKAGLQHAHAHLRQVYIQLGLMIPVSPAHFSPQAASTASPILMVPARPPSASHPHTAAAAALARGVAMPYMVHGIRQEMSAGSPQQQHHQQQQQAMFSAQLQSLMQPVAAGHPQAHPQSSQPIAPAIAPQIHTNANTFPVHQHRHSADAAAHSASLQRSKYSGSPEALQRCWALRTFFPHSFQLYIMSGPKRPDMLDHPFQAFQGTPHTRSRSFHDLTQLEPAKLEGDLEAMWISLIQASRYASEAADASSRATSPRDAVDVPSSPSSCGILSPTAWQNQCGRGIRAVDLFHLDGSSTRVNGSPIASSSDTAVQSTATDVEEDSEEAATPGHPVTEDKGTQTAAATEDQPTQHTTASTSTQIEAPLPPPPPAPEGSTQHQVEATPRAKKRRNKRSKSPARIQASVECQSHTAAVNAKAHAVEAAPDGCTVASVASVAEAHQLLGSTSFQSHLFTMVWSCMICILLMHFRFLEFSPEQPPKVAQAECTKPALPQNAVSCGECVCPHQAALPHWLRLNGSLSLGDLAAERGLAYQWVKDGAQIAGATGPFFNIQNATWEDAGVYECIVRNATALTSKVIRTVLHVGQPPRVKHRMIMQSLAIGQTLALHIEAEGLPTPQFQWRRNGIAIPGATSNIFVVPSVNLAHAGTYTCEIFNIAGRTLWEEATIAVEV